MLLAASLAAPIDVEVNRLDGSTRIGSLVSVSSEEVVLATGEGEVTLSARELFSLSLLPDDFEDEEAFDLEDPIRIDLTDGSHLLATSLQIEAGRATIDLISGGSTRCASRVIRTVQWKKQNPLLLRQWQEIAAAKQAGDVLVLRKTNREADANGAEQVTTLLDSLEGVIHDVTDEAISFDYQGTRVDIPLEKVEGVIYLSRGSTRMAEAVCRLDEESGTSWNLKSMKMAEDGVTGVTASGVRATVPLARILKVDYSIGNLVFLSDLTPEKVEWTPTVLTSSTPASLKSFYEPQNDRGFFGAPLALDGLSYEKGLAIHSRTEMQFRLTRAFRGFAAIAGLDSRFRSAGNVTLSIQGDGKELFSRKIVAEDDPVAIELDLKGVRRLTLLVDFGDDMSDIGDYLNLCDARLLK